VIPEKRHSKEYQFMPSIQKQGFLSVPSDYYSAGRGYIFLSFSTEKLLSYITSGTRVPYAWTSKDQSKLFFMKIYVTRLFIL
jgi:hypothetical protein